MPPLFPPLKKAPIRPKLWDNGAFYHPWIRPYFLVELALGWVRPPENFHISPVVFDKKLPCKFPFQNAGGFFFINPEETAPPPLAWWSHSLHWMTVLSRPLLPSTSWLAGMKTWLRLARDSRCFLLLQTCIYLYIYLYLYIYVIFQAFLAKLFRLSHKSEIAMRKTHEFFCCHVIKPPTWRIIPVSK